jgi:hypothetical protein
MYSVGRITLLSRAFTLIYYLVVVVKWDTNEAKSTTIDNSSLKVAKWYNGEMVKWMGHYG